ncbi:site-specific integrase [Paenibacillus tepidiphilus]|uniref:site-specific integrase n=1 Tax=Paenibacillus tepidiphilus TaxID=2608683 RepID=UPI001239BC0A|nr:site-specific integrase [Paenibacillus tepidiphilus]
MPSYEHRGKNSYRLTVETEAGINQKRGRELKTVKVPEGLSPKKQKDWLDAEWHKFKAEVEAGAYIAPEKMVFSAFVEEWKTKHAKGLYAVKTEEMNEYLLDNLFLPHLGHFKLYDFKTMHIVSFMNKIPYPKFRKSKKKKPLAQSTMISLHRLLKNIFEVAVAWKVITSSPMDGLKYPKRKKTKANCYNKQEAQQLTVLLDKEPLAFKVIIVLAITTGLRRGEIAGLEWRHINLDKGTITIEQQMVYTKKTGHTITDPKTQDANRLVSIPQLVVDLLKELRKQSIREREKLGSEWKGDDRLHVFTTAIGSPYRATYISNRWIEFIKDSGLRYIKFHELRHTSASLLINSGVHSKVVSDRLGHSDIRITMNTYGHVFEEAEHAAAEVFDSMLRTKSSK